MSSARMMRTLGLPESAATQKRPPRRIATREKQRQNENMVALRTRPRNLSRNFLKCVPGFGLMVCETPRRLPFELHAGNREANAPVCHCRAPQRFIWEPAHGLSRIGKAC